MTELKPCPFCGGEAEVFDYWNEGKKKSRWVVMCKNCKGGLGELDTKEEAIEKWNNRWMIPCEEGETKGDWHTGTPTEEGDYLLALRIENLKLDVAHFKDGVFMSYHDHIIASSYIKLWQKIEPYKEKEDGR